MKLPRPSQRFLRISVVVGCLLLAVATVVVEPARAAGETLIDAAQLDARPRVAGYLASPAIRQRLLDIALDLDRRLGRQSDCSEGHSVTLRGLTVLAPVTIEDGAEHPAQGAWIWRYDFARCGVTHIYNAVFVADTASGRPMARDHLPGTTRADARLVRDVAGHVATAGRVVSGQPDCRELQIADTRVEPTTPDNNFDRTQPWAESWTVLACGRQVLIPVRFVPDSAGGGTRFTIPLDR
jgi:hypothetical protein